MARNRNKASDTDTSSTETYGTREEEKEMTAAAQGTTEGEYMDTDGAETALTDGSNDEGLMGIEDPTDYDPILWPEKTYINVYTQRPRVVEVQNAESKAFGEKFFSVDLVAAEEQESEAMLEHAGEKFDVMLALKRGRNEDYQKLVVAALGEKRMFTAEEMTNVPLRITVRHAKDKKKGGVKMYLKDVFPDRN